MVTDGSKLQKSAVWMQYEQINAGFAINTVSHGKECTTVR